VRTCRQLAELRPTSTPSVSHRRRVPCRCRRASASLSPSRRSKPQQRSVRHQAASRAASRCASASSQCALAAASSPDSTSHSTESKTASKRTLSSDWLVAESSRCARLASMSARALLALRRQDVLGLGPAGQRAIYFDLLRLATRRSAAAAEGEDPHRAARAIRALFGAGPYWFLARSEEHRALPQAQRSRLIARRRRATFSEEHRFEFKYPSSRSFGHGTWRDQHGNLYNRGDAAGILFVKVPWGSATTARREPRPGETLRLSALRDVEVDDLTVRVVATDIKPHRATGRVFLRRPESLQPKAGHTVYKRARQASGGR
jgi:hypothetical protein